jgi:tripartite-type tricarboxylate transporter receptor subunit TctC
MRRRIIASLMLAAGLAISPVQAQTFPSKQITLVVPFTAGGPTDTLARILAERMSRILGQTVIVDNTTGAAGTVGVTRVVNAAPDGYTIGIGHWSTHVVNPAIYPLKFDILADLEPLADIATNPQLLVARKDLPATDLKSLVEWVKANGDKVTAGTAGVGAASHIAGLYFEQKAGVKLRFIPYRGAGPALQDLMAGQIDIMFDQAANSIPQVQAGKIKAFAVTAKQRLKAMPDIPTVDEPVYRGLARAVGAQGHAQGRDGQTLRRDHGSAGRPAGAREVCSTWPGYSSAGATDGRGAARPSQGGDRTVVAADQGGGDQDRIAAAPLEFCPARAPKEARATGTR